MDLIISFYDTYSVVPIQVLGTPLMGLTIFAMGVLTFFQYVFSLPFIRSLVNTTSVFLNNTQEVWKPLFDSTMIAVRPMGNALQPLVDVGLVMTEMTIRGMIIMGYVTAKTIREVGRYTLYAMEFTRDAGVSLTSSLGNAILTTKEFSSALYSVFRGLGFITMNLVKGAGFVVNSFEQTSDFLYQFFFYPHTVTWADISNIAVPFAIVASILGYVAWRSYSMVGRKQPTEVRTEVRQSLFPPMELRRSSRIARKRALLNCQDL